MPGVRNGRIIADAPNALKRFLEPGLKRRAGELCEMCGQPIVEQHSHVVNVESRSLMCTCRACYLLFTHSGAAQGRYRAVPDRVLSLNLFRLSTAEWDAMQIPVGMAFFFYNSSMKKITAFYPSPAGAAESMVPIEAWDELVASNPVLLELAPDVEALLIYRRRGEDRFQCFIVPIDACYELTGKVRRYWRGFDGGEEVWREIEGFFPACARDAAITMKGVPRLSELNFQIVGARPERHAAVPTLMFALKIEETTGIDIHNIVLRCQIRIEPIRRQYSREEEARLTELFGDTPRWGDTMKPFLWTHLSATVPGFRGKTEVELPVACTYDFEIAATKYLHSLESGDISLLMMFSGSVFEKGEHGMQVSQIPWSKEANYRLPVRVWQEMIDHYFPNSGWLRLNRDTLSDLMKFKSRRALATWDEVIETLLLDSREAPQ